MSSTEVIAERIAQMLAAERPSADLSKIQATLESINARLEKLERSASGQPHLPTRIPLPVHPSLSKYEIAETIADALIAGRSAERACTFEPNDRPCDHCSMCSSRGY